MHSHSYPKPMIYLHWIVAVLAGVAYSSHGNPLVSEWQGQIHVASGFSVFGISFTLPFFPEWQIDFSELHQRLANGFVLLAGLHALVALAHHFLWKDGVLRSMLG